MSEINLQFSVNTYSASFTAETNPIVINPVTNNLMMFTGFAAYPPAGGAGNGQVTFNDAGLFSGSNDFTYANSTNTLTAQNIVANTITSSGNVTIGNVTSTGNVSVSNNITTSNLTVNNKTTLGNIPNVSISGGVNGQFIKTDGAGNLSFSIIPAGGTNSQLQFNNANVLGGIPNVTWNGVALSLGDAGNVKLEGGINGYVLQTDGTGNLTWQAQAGNVTGNGSPGGANTQIQYNRTGVFGGSAGFTYNNVSNTLSVQNIALSGTIVGTLTGNATFYNANVTNFLDVTGTTRIRQGIEKVAIDTALTGTINWDLLANGSIQYFSSNATGNSIINFRGNSTTTFDTFLSTGESLTVALLSKIGTTIYWPTTIQVDGANRTVQFVGGAAPSNTSVSSNSVTCFNYTFVKTDTNAYTVLGTFNSFI